MKNHDWNPFLLNRRLVLKGAGGLMLGLPLLEGFMSNKASTPFDSGESHIISFHSAVRTMKFGTLRVPHSATR